MTNETLDAEFTYVSIGLREFDPGYWSVVITFWKDAGSKTKISERIIGRFDDKNEADDFMHKANAQLALASIKPN